MSQQAWTVVQETEAASQARRLAASAASSQATSAESTSAEATSAEATFWLRDDLIFVGDLDWTQAGYEGYEYIADIQQRQSGGFTYIYALVALADASHVAQTMICEVRDQQSDPDAFEMKIGESWQPGPLQAWLDSLQPDVQALARNRYRDLVRWVRFRLQSS